MPSIFSKSNRLKGWSKNNDGAAAVEFAFMALPLFWLILTILELSILFMVQLVVDHAMEQTKRSIVTGEAQANGWNENTLKQNICGLSLGLVRCNNINLSTEFQDLCSQINQPTTYTGLGGSEQCTLIRLTYDWPLFTPSFTGALSGNNDGTYTVIVHTVAISERF